MKNFLFIMLIFPVPIFSQTNFSISANTGLVMAEKSLGGVLMARSVVEFDRNSMEFGYLYSELINKNDTDIRRVYKYSLTGGRVIYSDDKKFQFSGKLGPSLMYFRGFDSDKPKIGLDMGLTMSYTLFWDTLDFEMGLVNSLNKETKGFVYTFFGFKYNFRNKE